MSEKLIQASQSINVPVSALANGMDFNDAEQKTKFFEGLDVDECESITFKLSLSSCIFELYHASTEPPSAPLLLKRHEKDLLDLSKELDVEDGQEFEVSEKVKKGLEKVLGNDDLFSKTAVHLKYESKSGEKHLQLSSKVIYNLGLILNPILSLFDEKEESSDE